MLSVIHDVAGNNPALCEALSTIYVLCEGVSEPVKRAYELLDNRFCDGDTINGDYIAHIVDINAQNYQDLSDALDNPRMSSEGIAWNAFMREYAENIADMNGRNLTSEQYKNWFRMHGQDFREVMAKAVAEVNQIRENRRIDNEAYAAMNAEA